MNFSTRNFIKTFVFLTAAVAVSGCTGSDLSVNSSEKEEVLRREAVFSNGLNLAVNNDGEPTKNPNNNDGDSPRPRHPNNNDPRNPFNFDPRNPFNFDPRNPFNFDPRNPLNNDPVPPTTAPGPQPVDITFTFLCSDRVTREVGTTLLKTDAVKVQLVSSTGQVSCELTGDFKTEILNTKKLKINPCPNLEVGSYSLRIVDTQGRILNQETGGGNFIHQARGSKVIYTVNADGSTSARQSSSIQVLYDTNLQSLMMTGPMNMNNDACDRRASPLIVNLKSDNEIAKGIELTAPVSGVQFDILGQKSFPRAHVKKQISWFRDSDHQYHYIVLPNHRGQVLGIDEMFGDNTRGPDGRFASDGYAALAKYDKDRDGYITENDPIFSSLKLWHDANIDGSAQASELVSLSEKSISVIDLNYDNRFAESDIYGNQTLMKSVVKTEDGKLYLMFDLWFRYLNILK